MDSIIIAAFVLSAAVVVYNTDDYVTLKKHRAALSALFLVPFLVYSLSQAVAGGLVFRSGFGSATPFSTILFTAELAVYLMAFFGFYVYLSGRDRLRGAVVLLGLVTCVLSSAGFYGKSDARTNALRALIDIDSKADYSFFADPNHFGAFLAMAAPLFLATIAYYALSRQKGWRISVEGVEKAFLALLIPVIMFSAVSADARGPLFWLFFMIALFFFLWAAKRPWLAIPPVALTAAVGAYFLKNVASLAAGRLSTDWAARAQIMKDALGMFKDFPWFGTGLGTSRFVYGFYQTAQPENFTVTHPFNQFIQLLGETGLFGALLFLAPVLYFVFSSFFASQESSSRFNRLYGLAAFIVILTYCVPAMFDNYLRTHPIAILMAFIAAILARCTNGSLDPKPPHDGPPPPLLKPGMGRAAALVLSLAIALPLLVYHWREASARGFYLAEKKTEEGLARATELSPNNAFAWRELADLRYNMAVRLKKQKSDYRKPIHEAIVAYRQAVRSAPTWPDSWTGLGKSEILAGQEELGSRHLNFGARLNPRNRDRILHLIYVHLTMAEETPWKDEKEIFLRRAEYWSKVGMTLPRPLSPVDCFYLRNNTKAQISPKGKALLARYLSKLYRKTPAPSVS